jgi:general nucleoside transport system ATP-binding protein
MHMALEVKGFTKRFPGVVANQQIDFDLLKGEIHALLGENGAGKTTLMNCIYGLCRPDEGVCFLDEEEVLITDPNTAIDNGIGMVHQHFMLVPTLTVAENIVLGVETLRKETSFLKQLGLLDMRTAVARIEELSEQYGLEVDPHAYVRDLAVGAQQRVEIVKALYREADVLILDEPTAVLTPQEADDLFVIMRSLTERGKSLIFITHKLREVLAVADRITVLRGGKVVGTTTPAETSQQDLATMMVGRDVNLTVDKGPADPREVVLDVRGLVVQDDRHLIALNGVSFQVRAGEILGVAGVQGNGQRELVEALTGLRKAQAGHVELLGKDVTNASPRKITEAGSAHIPEDRQKHGLVLVDSVADNLVLNTYYLDPFARGAVINREAVRANADARVAEFDIRTPSVDAETSNLSGGNQQKTIVAREFSRPIKLLVAAQPTRGLDVGSIEFIHRQLVDRRDRGVAVLLVSAELDEIMALADRVAVMYHGEIVDVMPIEEATREKLGLIMAGVTA